MCKHNRHGMLLCVWQMNLKQTLLFDGYTFILNCGSCLKAEIKIKVRFIFKIRM